MPPWHGGAFHSPLARHSPKPTPQQFTGGVERPLAETPLDRFVRSQNVSPLSTLSLDKAVGFLVCRDFVKIRRKTRSAPVGPLAGWREPRGSRPSGELPNWIGAASWLVLLPVKRAGSSCRSSGEPRGIHYHSGELPAAHAITPGSCPSRRTKTH